MGVRVEGKIPAAIPSLVEGALSSNREKMTIKGLGALLVGYWQLIPPLTQALLWVMVGDIVLGIAVAIKTKNLSRQIMFDGVTKKVTVLVLMGVAAVLNPHVQPLIGIDLVRAASFFYLAYEVTSVVRNAAILEVPVFNQLQDVLRYFHVASGDRKNLPNNPAAAPNVGAPGKDQPK
jgi:toxin secretion/phage lysis holin